MKTLDDKIAEIREKAKKIDENLIKDYEFILKHNIKTDADIPLLKIECELRLGDTRKLHAMGWQYFDDVCYLDNIEIIKKDKNIELHGELFEVMNYLAYLFWHIKRLNITQEHVNRKRCEKSLAKSISETLNYIGESKVTNELTDHLAGIAGNFSDLIKDPRNRAKYQSKKTSDIKFARPYLNIDKRSELRKEYKEKVKKLFDLKREQSPLSYKGETIEILEAFKLPKAPSQI